MHEPTSWPDALIVVAVITFFGVILWRYFDMIKRS